MSVFNICIELFIWCFVFVLLFFNRLCVSVYIGPKLNVNPKCHFFCVCGGPMGLTGSITVCLLAVQSDMNAPMR